jgi:hypothetical protein
MTRPRAVRPTDLVALVSFDGRVYPNEAKTRSRIGSGDSAPHPLGRALEQWFSFATGCHTWISIKGATLHGLVSARRRRSKTVWELDCVINAAEDDGICIGLLEQSLRDAVRAHVERVFLRLSSESCVLPMARRIGFCAYQHENLMSSGEPRPLPRHLDGLPRFRKATRSDERALYDLYRACSTEQAREAEAVTFDEWRSAQDRSWLTGRVSQQVALRDDSIVAWYRSALNGSCADFDLLLHPAEPAREALFDVALGRIGGSSAVTLVPDSATTYIRGLQKRGFERGPEFVSLVMRTAVPVKSAQLAPAV